MDQSYGGCEGPDAMYVKLISSDGHEFIVKREHALTSGTIKGETTLTGCCDGDITIFIFQPCSLVLVNLLKTKLMKLTSGKFRKMKRCQNFELKNK